MKIFCQAAHGLIAINLVCISGIVISAFTETKGVSHCRHKVLRYILSSEMKIFCQAADGLIAIKLVYISSVVISAFMNTKGYYIAAKNGACITLQHNG
jgi:hypothetical protein